MAQKIIFLLIAFLSLSLSVRHLGRVSKPVSVVCKLKDSKMIYPMNSTFTSLNYFLGTGKEFRFRAHGKYVKIKK